MGRKRPFSASLLVRTMGMLTTEGTSGWTGQGIPSPHRLALPGPILGDSRHSFRLGGRWGSSCSTLTSESRHTRPSAPTS